MAEIATRPVASLMYHPPVTSKPMSDEQLADELFAAESRFVERTGHEPTRLWVASGELIEAEGLDVREDARLPARTWLLGVEGSYW